MAAASGVESARLSIWFVGSIPIARSINPDDTVDLTRLSYLNSTKKRLVLDGSWTVLDAIGRSLLDRTVEGPSEQLIADDVFRVRAFENKYEKPTIHPNGSEGVSE